MMAFLRFLNHSFPALPPVLSTIFGYIMYASFVCVSPLMAWLYGLLSVPRDDGHGDRRREGFMHSL